MKESKNVQPTDAVASPSVSVIVPAYNAEKYLEEAVGSATGQGFDGLEVIIVDDASTDSTPDIATKLADENKDIVKVIRHDKNRGLAAARNTGLDHAIGDMILFLDADDSYLPGSLSLLTRTMSMYPETDMVSGGFTTTGIAASGVSSASAVAKPAKLMTAYDALRHALYQDRVIDHSAWGKLFRRTLFDQIRFKEGTWYEDLEIFPRLMEKARKVAVIPQFVYFYRQNPQSFVHTWNPGRLDSMKVSEDVLRFVESSFPALSRAARSRRLSACMATFILGRRHKEAEVADQAWQVIRKERKEALSDPDVRLKNKFGLLLSYFGQRPILLLSRLFKKYN